MSRDVTYDDGQTLRERTAAAVGDEQLRANLQGAARSWTAGQDRMREEFGFDEMR